MNESQKRKLLTAHQELGKFAADAGYDAIPISIISVKPGDTGQITIFNDETFDPGVVAERLRSAANFIEMHYDVKGKAA